MDQQVATWQASDSKDNATATATKAAVTGGAHYVTSLVASFSAAAAGKLLQLKDGSTVIGTFYVHNQLPLVFAHPIRITHGAAVSAVLAASGAGGVTGAVQMMGFTVGG